MSQAPSGRKRIRLSCEPCREKKRKCDQALLCGPCNTRGIQCVWAPYSLANYAHVSTKSTKPKSTDPNTTNVPTTTGPLRQPPFPETYEQTRPNTSWNYPSYNPPPLHSHETPISQHSTHGWIPHSTPSGLIRRASVGSGSESQNSSGYPLFESRYKPESSYMPYTHTGQKLTRDEKASTTSNNAQNTNNAIPGSSTFSPSANIGSSFHSNYSHSRRSGSVSHMGELVRPETPSFPSYESRTRLAPIGMRNTGPSPRTQPQTPQGPVDASRILCDGDSPLDYNPSFY